MHSALGKKTAVLGSIVGDMTVQDALESSGAMKKYRAMDIEVLRVVDTADTGRRGLRMKVMYVPSEKSIIAEQNYALHDGDRIVITPVSNDPMSKVIGMLGQSK